MEILDSLRERALAADDSGRKAIIDQLNRLARELETPQDCMQRILYQPIILSLVRAGCDLGLFNHIVDSAQPLSSAQLAEKCIGNDVSPILLGRLLRYMASVDVVCETATDRYGPTTTTRTLASSDWQSAVYHNCDLIMPSIAALPEFFKESGYVDPKDPANCAFNRAHGTGYSFFEWIPTQPERYVHFNRFMRVQREGMPAWLDAYPFLAVARAADPARPLFVDVGGGVGHQSQALRNALSDDLPGRIVVQDQPAVLAQASPYTGVELMPHDMFEAQPVRGAHMYYMRNVMHDWLDADAEVILRHTREAMTADSRLLIDEMVLPDEGVHWYAGQVDMVVMAIVAARERTMRQWQELVPRAGLRINKVYKYTESLCHSIIECVRDDVDGV